MKKDLKGENNAKQISDCLPFIEYELHRQLINKLKVKGMNGLFGLTTKLSVSDRTVIATATATAAMIAALPAPSRPRLAITDHHHFTTVCYCCSISRHDEITNSLALLTGGA